MEIVLVGVKERENAKVIAHGGAEGATRHIVCCMITPYGVI